MSYWRGAARFWNGPLDGWIKPNEHGLDLKPFITYTCLDKRAPLPYTLVRHECENLPGPFEHPPLKQYRYRLTHYTYPCNFVGPLPAEAYEYFSFGVRETFWGLWVYQLEG